MFSLTKISLILPLIIFACLAVFSSPTTMHLLPHSFCFGFVFFIPCPLISLPWLLYPSLHLHQLIYLFPLLFSCVTNFFFPAAELVCLILQSLGGSSGRRWAQLWPGSPQYVVGSGMHPTLAVGFPLRTCFNYVTPVLLIGAVESAVGWQENCLFKSYYGSGGSEPPDIFSSSTWERWTEEMCPSANSLLLNAPELLFIY